MAQPWLRELSLTAKVLPQNQLVRRRSCGRNRGFPTTTWLMGSMGTARLPAAYVLDSFTLLSDFGDEPRANMVGQ